MPIWAKRGRERGHTQLALPYISGKAAGMRSPPFHPRVALFCVSLSTTFPTIRSSLSFVYCIHSIQKSFTLREAETLSFLLLSLAALRHYVG